MAIGLLLNNWGTWGGAATYHGALVRALQQRGIEVEVALPFGKEHWELPKDIPFASGMNASIRALQKCRTWIVWGIGHKTKLDVFIRRKRTRPKIVVINHGGSDNAWSCKCMAAESGHADVIVGVSQDSLLAVPSEFRSKGIVISGPVDRDRLTPFVPVREMRNYLRLSDGQKAAVYLGRIAAEKRVDVAIDAMRYMPENWKLFIVGDSPGSISPSSLFGNFNVHLCGPTATPGDYLQLADCTVSPSPSEGFGLSVIEAISLGVPTVAHKTGILKDLDIGTTLPTNASPQQFAAAMIQAENAKDKAAKDKEAIKGMFTVSSFLEKWTSLL